MTSSAAPGSEPQAVQLKDVVRGWTRIGCIGFGGPPAHIALFRELCVDKKRWLNATEFEDAIAATNLLPGPGSTQLAIFCGWRVAGVPGALLGGACFILPGLFVIIGLAALFLAGSPPTWVRGAGAGAGSAVAAVAIQAGSGLLPPGWVRTAGLRRVRWVLYVLIGAASAATLGPWLVLLLLACGFVELAFARAERSQGLRSFSPLPFVIAAAAAGGTFLALGWVAFKVGALSYGGGFVIIPLMQAEAVDHYHWMTSAQFLNAVALGQVTPGPVVHTVAVVGYAAAGIAGAFYAAVIAFAPSFSFILLGADRFDRLRADARVRAFLEGAGPAAIGAILGSAIPLALALTETWQFCALAAAAVALLLLRRGVVSTLLAAGAVGVVIALAGGPVPA